MKRVEWDNVTVFRKDWENGGTSYRCSLSGHPWNAQLRQADKRWISLWHTLKFPAGTNIPDRAKINLRGIEFPEERNFQGQQVVAPRVNVEYFEIVGQPNYQQPPQQNYQQQNQPQQCFNNGNGQQNGFNQPQQVQNGFQQQQGFTTMGFDDVTDDDIPF